MKNSTYQYKLSESQMEVWLLAQTNEDANCSCNEIATLEFTGEVDASKLQQAIQKVVQRNDGLRTTFHKLGEYAEVHQELGFGYQTHDWTGLDADESDSRHRELVIQEGRTPFDLENGPLLRVHFQKMESQKDQLEALKEIRTIMEKSSKFISLSGIMEHWYGKLGRHVNNVIAI